MIAIDQLEVIRRGFSLGPLDLTVGSGEYFVLLGPSGSGKTTLLEWIAGFVSSDRGTLQLGEQNATHLPPQQRALGVVYQDSALFPNMSVRENLGFALRMRGESEAACKRSVEQTAERLHISHRLDAPIHAISGGEKRRVALGRALVAERKILLLDEPLTGLDPALRREMRLELRAIQRELGLTIFHITHLMGEARMLADRLGVILGGKLLQSGSYEQLTNEPADERVASALAVENFVAGTVREGALICNSTGAALPAPVNAGDQVRGRVSELRLALSSQGSKSIEGLYQGTEPGNDGALAALVRVGQSATHPGILLHASIPGDVRVDPLQYGDSVFLDFANANWHLY